MFEDRSGSCYKHVMKASDFIAVLENTDAAALSDHDEGGHALLVLLAKVYFADGRLHEGELAQMKRLTGTNEVIALLADLNKEDLKVARLGELYPDAQDRDDIVTLVEHAVWSDRDPDHKEWDIVDELVETLNIQRD